MVFRSWLLISAKSENSSKNLDIKELSALVIFAVIEFKKLKTSKPLQEQLKKAIDHVNKSPEKFELKEAEKYRQKIVKQLKYFKDIVEVLKFDDFYDMIDLACEVLLNLSNLKLENLKSTCSHEMNSLINEIDKYLPKWTEWIDSCTEITNKFIKIYEDLSNFVTDNNIKDNLLFFEIQEELLTKVDEIKTKLHKASGKLDKIISFSKSHVEEEIYSNFLLVIELKSIYDLAMELECARSRFKLLDPIFVKEISELTHRLQLIKGLVEKFKDSECELHVKECCHHCIVEILKDLQKLGIPAEKMNLANILSTSNLLNNIIGPETWKLISLLRSGYTFDEALSDHASLVPKKCKALNIVGKGSEKKMKKIHNTRRKGISSARSTGSTSSDWSEIMEHKAIAEKQQRQCKVDNFLKKNSMVSIWKVLATCAMYDQ
ncbi:8663_t:CDS:2, partial [Gigaspora margarita]